MHFRINKRCRIKTYRSVHHRHEEEEEEEDRKIYPTK